MPADITGTDILQDDPETGRRQFVFLQGPIFANMILADEINRTPPKTQAALLEAMQEHHVTAGGQTYRLPEPFFVLATQNPIEQEGTYPLPEAQLDRFMFNIIVGYPQPGRGTGDHEADDQYPPRGTGSRSSTASRSCKLQEVVRQVVVADHVFAYAADLVRATRPKRAGRAEVRPGVGGVGGRAAGQPVPDPRRQGPGDPARPAARHHRGHPRGRLPRAAASAGDDVQRRRRGRNDGHGCYPLVADDPAAARGSGGAGEEGVTMASVDELYEQALQLSPAERTLLSDRLFQSTLPEVPGEQVCGEEAEALLMETIKCRSDELHAGTVQTRGALESLEELRRGLHAERLRRQP